MKIFILLRRNGTHDGPVKVTGPPGLDAVLGPKTQNGRSITAKLENIGIPLKNRRLITDLNLRGIVGRADWELSISQSRLAFIQEEKSNSSVEFAGSIRPGFINFPVVSFMDSSGLLEGEAVFRNYP